MVPACGRRTQVPKWSSGEEATQGADGTDGEGGGEDAQEGGEDEEAAERRSPGDEDLMQGFRVPLNARSMHEKVRILVCVCLGCLAEAARLVHAFLALTTWGLAGAGDRSRCDPPGAGAEAACFTSGCQQHYPRPDQEVPYRAFYLRAARAPVAHS